MHGPAPAPPARPAASVGVIAVRVIISVLIVLSLGLLSWVAMLRIAIMRGRGKDWVLFWGQLALNITCLGMLHTAFADSWISDAGMAGLLVMALVVVIHYLIADIHHHQRPRYPPAPPMWIPPVPYGPPHPGLHPYAQAPQPQVQPQPQPEKPRIEQVRAELDELSDYLRKDRKEEGK